jgi:tetratricopeptide (TPR) repeat protein
VKLGRERDAEADFKAALELKPDLYTAHQALARLSWKRGARAIAIGHYAEMIAIAPQNPAGHFLMGRALESRRRPREALVRYRNALAVDPEHEDARRGVERIEGSLANPAAER